MAKIIGSGEWLVYCEYMDLRVGNVMPFHSSLNVIVKRSRVHCRLVLEFTSLSG